MTTIGIIVSKMVFCLIMALMLGLFFGYMIAKARNREFCEDKIDALEELCEAKKREASELKTKYGNMEIEITKLQDRCAHDEKIIANCKEKEDEMLAQLELLAEKNEKLQQSLDAVEKQQKQEPVVKFDSTEVLKKIEEITHLLAEKSESLTQEIKQEIIEDVDVIKKELQNGENSSKIVTFLQNIMKKLKS